MPGRGPPEPGHHRGRRRDDLRGERKPEPEVPDERYYRRERPIGVFTRTVSLGERLDPDATQASYRNGILRLQLARAPEATPKKITIQS